MSNVAKLKKKAAEFELKRQFDKALAIYIELLDDFDAHADEVDVALFNRVGDMLLRQGNVADAVDYYERAVDKYADSGFFNNAIALCNKILRQSPGRTSVYYKLGKISAQKGFKSDAKQNFLEYADRMQKAGRMDEAFRALKEFADLCPDQDDIRLMLADQLSRQARSGEAIEQLQTLFDRYSADGRDVEARATLDRIRAIDPAYEPRTTGQQAAQKSSDLVFLDVYATDDSPRRDTPADPLAGLPIQRFDEEPAPAKPAPPPLPPAAPPPPAAAPAPAPPQFLDPGPVADLVGFESTAIGGEAAPDGMLGLEPTAFGSGSMDTVRPDPKRPTLDGLQTTHFEPPAPAPPAPPASAPAASDFAFLPPDAIQPGTEASVPEAPPGPLAFDDLPMMDLEIPTAPPSLRPTGDVPAISAGEVSADQRQAFADAWSAGATDDVVSSLDMGFDIPGFAAPGAADLAAPTRQPPPVHPPASAGLHDFADLEPALDAAVDRTRSSTIAAEQSVERLESEVLAHPDDLALRRQLAEARLESGDREGGIADLEACMAALERMEDIDGAGSLADEIARLTPSSVRIHQKRVEYAFRTSDRPRLVAAYLDLAAALLGDGQTDKARTVYRRVLDLAPDDVAAQAGLAALASVAEEAPAAAAPRQSAAPARPTPSQAGASVSRGGRRDDVRAAPPKPLPAAPASEDAFVNLGDWLREDEAPRSTRMIVDEKEPSGDEEADFAEMLRKFKQGVAENVDAEDHQAHYDLGVAFKEMGLVDEAIAEFQKALRAPSNRLPTYEALGQCFVEKGQYQVAAAILSRALSEQRATDEQLIGVLYLLGVAAEAAGRHQEAVEFYQRVFVIDIEFRDVADRLAAIEQPRR